MSRVNDVLAWFPAIGVPLRKRLLADLTEAERVQAAAAPTKPKYKVPSKPTGTDPSATGAMASEAAFSTDVLAHYNRCCGDTRVFLAEVLEAAGREQAAPTPTECQIRAAVLAEHAARYPRPAAEALRPDELLAAAADRLMLSDDPPADYGAAMTIALEADPALAAKYAARFNATGA